MTVQVPLPPLVTNQWSEPLKEVTCSKWQEVRATAGTRTWQCLILCPGFLYGTSWWPVDRLLLLICSWRLLCKSFLLVWPLQVLKAEQGMFLTLIVLAQSLEASPEMFLISSPRSTGTDRHISLLAAVRVLHQAPALGICLREASWPVFLPCGMQAVPLLCARVSYMFVFYLFPIHNSSVNQRILKIRFYGGYINVGMASDRKGNILKPWVLLLTCILHWYYTISKDLSSFWDR